MDRSYDAIVCITFKYLSEGIREKDFKMRLGYDAKLPKHKFT